MPGHRSSRAHREDRGKVGKVMHEFKAGTLHSGSSKGPKVTSRKQAIAIGMSEQRKMMHEGVMMQHDALPRKRK